MPVSLQTTPRQKVKGTSYGYVNQMLISCNKEPGADACG
jgi:hypothetical protein